MSTQGSSALLDDDDSWDVLISAIEHFSYCPRQCGLIHVEQSYSENQFTVRGVQAHERADSGEDGLAGGVPVSRALPLWSVEYGLRGKSDVVEFHPDGPYPVEYKVGGRQSDHAVLQLCAQALCLEEMLGQPVHHGAIFSHAQRRRLEVAIDSHLRARTLTVVAEIRAMLQQQTLPAAVNDARCRDCSLRDLCLPDIVANPQRIRGLHSSLYQATEVRDIEDE
jgi:CRISPR-associated exonuclease Cas4